jgi:formylglycine-generating enzyme required for sulfatase activity
LIRLLRAHPFLTLIGPSGSGKSSLVYAGLIPKLRQSRVFGRGEWLLRDLRPGENPWESLSEVLGGDPSLPEDTVSTLLSHHLKAQRLLVFVDQFEELFTVAKGDTTAFQEALVSLAEVPNTYVIVTARADFYPALMLAPLWPEIQKHRYQVLPRGEDSLAEAIFKPAEKVGVYVESALVERLVADARGEPGILPFVQETMILLWDKVERRYLPLSAYETLVLPRKAYGERAPGELTGLQVAIALRADATLSDLKDKKQQAIARRIFVRLVQFGEGRPDTRRRQPISRLRVAGEDSTLFGRTLDHLSNEKHRLLILSGEEGIPERRVDIAHEALIGAWPTLQEWLKQRRRDEQMRRRFVEDADEWAEKGRDAFFLYEGTRLEEIHCWAQENLGELDKEQQEFLEASEKRDRRRKQLQLFLRGVLALFSLIGLAATVYGIRLAILNFSARGAMVSFPAGTAILGSDAVPELHDGWIHGIKEVELAAFSIDKYEVTNRQYRLCVQAGACSPPLEPAIVPSYQELDEDLPVVWVTAYQAAAFCRWIGRRLPTEEEWERAARGSEGRIWPWEGDTPPSPSRANLRYQPSLEEPPPAPGEILDLDAPPPDFDGPPPDPGHMSGSGDLWQGELVAVNDPDFMDGATPEGVAHMLGNAFEWTSTPGECEDPYDCPTPWDGKRKVALVYLRGLSYLTTISADDLESGDRPFLNESLGAEPSRFEADIGFRCAGP